MCEFNNTVVEHLAMIATLLPHGLNHMAAVTMTNHVQQRRVQPCFQKNKLNKLYN